jgi:hypothetical protein
MVYYLLFFFLAVGAKLLLALVMIYLLLPAERSCNSCDGETLLMQMGRSNRLLSWLCRGRLQRRWCPACGWEGYARPVRAPTERALSPESPPGSKRRDVRKFFS